MCPTSPRASRVPPTVSPAVSVWLITTATESLQHICSTQPTSGRCLLPLLMLKTHFRVVWQNHLSCGGEVCVVVGGGAWIACSIKWTCARKHADRKTDKSPLVSSSSSPLSSLLFCSFFLRSAVLLFSLRDETQDATLCCLSAFNICLPLPHSSPHLYLFLCWLFSPLSVLFPLLSLFLSPHCVQSLCFFNLSCILFTLLFSPPTLSLCASFYFYFSSLFSPLFCSARLQQDFYLILPSEAANLWCWPVQKWALQNHIHNPLLGWQRSMCLGGWLSCFWLIGVSRVRWCVCTCMGLRVHVLH